MAIANRKLATVLILAGLTLTGFGYWAKSRTQPQTRENQNTIQAQLSKLESASSDERLAAVRFFAAQPPLTSSADLQKLGTALTDNDPRMRAAVAGSLGASRRQFNLGKDTRILRESQMIEMLAAAYSAEKDATVRKEIVSAAGEFNHPDAVALINQALEDSDAGVREQAQRSKNYREQRLLQVRIG